MHSFWCVTHRNWPLLIVSIKSQLMNNWSARRARGIYFVESVFAHVFPPNLVIFCIEDDWPSLRLENLEPFLMRFLYALMRKIDWFHSIPKELLQRHVNICPVANEVFQYEVHTVRVILDATWRVCVLSETCVYVKREKRHQSCEATFIIMQIWRSYFSINKRFLYEEKMVRSINGRDLIDISSSSAMRLKRMASKTSRLFMLMNYFRFI